MAHDPMGVEDGDDCPAENPFSPNASQPKYRPEYRPSDYIFMAYGGVVLRDVLLWDEVDEDVDPACAW